MNPLLSLLNDIQYKSDVTKDDLLSIVHTFKTSYNALVEEHNKALFDMKQTQERYQNMMESKKEPPSPELLKMNIIKEMQIPLDKFINEIVKKGEKTFENKILVRSIAIVRGTMEAALANNNAESNKIIEENLKRYIAYTN